MFRLGVAVAVVVSAVVSAEPARAHGSGRSSSVSLPAAENPVASPTARFVPVPSARVFDTRLSGRLLSAGGSHTIPVAGLEGVPADALAVAVNLTMVNASSAGYVSASPSGRPRPDVSNVNAERAGQTVATAAVVSIGSNGAIDVFSSVDTDLIVDVSGVWVPAAAATSGRYVPIAPKRVFDTRNARRPDHGIDVDINLRSVAPGASAVVMNLIATDAESAGYITMRPSGTGRSPISNLNIAGPQNTVANVAIVPVGSDGAVTMSVFRSMHVIVDIAGYFTGSSAPMGSEGLFVPITPTRAFDSRTNSAQLRLRAGPPRTLALGATGVVPVSGVSAVLATITATNAVLPGFVTAYPSSWRTPETSNLNVDHTWQTVANLSLTAVGPASTIVLRADRGAEMLVDVSGYFTGSPFPASNPPPVPGLYSPEAEPATNGSLKPLSTVTGDISPKSVVATGTGLVLAQNMMYQHTVTVYDRSGALVSTIRDAVGELRGAPVEMAMAVDGLHAYVSNYSMYGPGAGPEGFDACSPSSAVGDSTVYRIDLTTFGIDQVIAVGRVPKFLATTPDGRLLVVSNWCGDDVSIIDTSTAKEIRRVRVGRYPRGLAISANSRLAYVALMGAGQVAVVDIESGSIVDRFAVGGGPRHLNLAPDGKHLYVTLNEERSVVKVDLATKVIVGRATTGDSPRSAALSTDGTALFVVNYESNTASKIRTVDMTVQQTVQTARNPIGITYDDETRQLWVSCYVGEIRRFLNETITVEIT
jgi:YVTN family beta-propeller protein